MSDLSSSLLGSWVRRFLLEHLVGECNLARNTRLSYRDALSLLLPFAAKTLRKDVDRLAVTDVAADVVRKFLAHLESVTPLYRRHPQSTPGGHSCAGQFPRGTQS